MVWICECGALIIGDVNALVATCEACLDICNVTQTLEDGRYELERRLKGLKECIYTHIDGVVYVGR